MTTVHADLTDDEKRRFVLALITATPGLSEDALYDAYKALYDLQTSAILFTLWREGKATAGWNPETKELTWTEAAEA